jgi:hypothetical protein
MSMRPIDAVHVMKVQLRYAGAAPAPAGCGWARQYPRSHFCIHLAPIQLEGARDHNQS